MDRLVYDVSVTNKGLSILMFEDDDLYILSNALEKRKYITVPKNMRHCEIWGAYYSHTPEKEHNSRMMTQLEFDLYSFNQEKNGKSINCCNAFVWHCVSKVVNKLNLRNACSKLVCRYSSLLNDSLVTASPTLRSVQNKILKKVNFETVIGKKRVRDTDSGCESSVGKSSVRCLKF